MLRSYCARCLGPCPSNDAPRDPLRDPDVNGLLCRWCREHSGDRPGPSDRPTTGSPPAPPTHRPGVGQQTPRPAAGRGDRRSPGDGTKGQGQRSDRAASASGPADTLDSLFDPAHLSHLVQRTDHGQWLHHRSLHHSLLGLLIRKTNPAALLTPDPALFLDVPDLAELGLFLPCCATRWLHTGSEPGQGPG